MSPIPRQRVHKRSRQKPTYYIMQKKKKSKGTPTNIKKKKNRTEKTGNKPGEIYKTL